ncbi:MAG: AraC family transcriptional regulator [Bacteroidetes bacterium]|nr:MAG: AraC family transcriptional regulator [Bacteroidota bacterium]
MLDLELHTFTPVDPVLKKLIKYYWFIKSNNEIEIHGKLIPMNNIDLILNLSAPIRYTSSKGEESFQGSHFAGIQNKYRVVQQKGIVDIVGISFFPTGFYPVIKIPLSEFANTIVAMDTVIPGFESKMERIAEIESNEQRITAIEKTLMGLVDLRLLPEKNYDLLVKDFLMNGDSINIKNYCEQHCINHRTLERFFNKYVGTTPKNFLKTTKFQKTMNRLKNRDFDSMTQIGYEFNYYDQTHFINSFKSFTGKTPLKQLKQNDLIIHSFPKR